LVIFPRTATKGDSYFNVHLHSDLFYLLSAQYDYVNIVFCRGFRALQGSMRQRERKKFLMYSIYAWGSASILSIVCAIMDFVPSVPKELIRPEIGVTKCWFNSKWMFTDS